MEALLDLGADVADKGGNTPLHVAVQNGYGQSSVLLLHGTSMWKACNHGRLPLHAASANPYYGCASVQHLLSYGADVNFLHTQRRTPLCAAACIKMVSHLSVWPHEVRARMNVSDIA